jgi:hypothetical protein
VFFHFSLVYIWDFELLDVDWLLGLECNFMEEGFCLPKVELVMADYIVILQDDL